MRYSQELKFAREVADAADAIALERFQALDLIVTTKADNTPVTDADKATEEAIRRAITSTYPQDGIIGEEYGEAGRENKRYWVIDPIDGTKNFLRGVPVWATLIALVERDESGSQEVIVGVVSAPALGRRWFAAKGEGAHLQIQGSAPEKIEVSKVSAIADASIAYSDFQGWGEGVDKFHKLLGDAWRSRGYGDFWSHMLVAEGAVDVAIEPTLALWDMAALDVIIREAGGKFTDIQGVDGPYGVNAISTNGYIHEKIVKSLHG